MGRLDSDSWAMASLVITLGSLMAVEVFGIEGGLEAPRPSPGLEVDECIHHSPAELVKARPAADHSLLLQRAWRKAQIGCCFGVGEVARGWPGLSRVRRVIARCRAHSVGCRARFAVQWGVEIETASGW